MVSVKHVSVKGLLKVLAVSVVTIGGLLMNHSAQAASLTSVKDTLSTVAASANANHTIQFVSPSGVTNGSTIEITFPAGFSLTGVVEDDVDIAGSTEGELTTAANCAAAEKASVAISGQVLTITLCSGDGGDFTGAETITIEVGDNATASGTGSNKIDNPTAGGYVVSIAGTMTDSGAYAVSIISDDSVNITATVPTAITLTISDTTIGFGNLVTANARYANSTATGSDTSTAAHTFTIATNAATGYAITYYGATLTSGGNTISAATISNDDDGTPGSEQFAFGVTTNGNGTIASGYDANTTADYNFVPSTTTPFFSETGPTATETISAYYIANISGTTEAGSYSTDITYVATGTF